MSAIDPARLDQARDRVRGVNVVSEQRRPFFTPNALAEYLCVSPRTVRQMLADRRIESVKIEGVRRIPAEAVDAYVARRTVKAR